MRHGLADHVMFFLMGVFVFFALTFVTALFVVCFPWSVFVLIGVPVAYGVGRALCGGFD